MNKAKSQSYDDDKILILGAMGRLGSALKSRFTAMNKSVISVGTKRTLDLLGNVVYAPEDADLLSRLASGEVNTVVNCAARWGKNVSEGEIEEASMQMPLKILASLKPEPTMWIQIDSYFNLYYELEGVDKDYYSKIKRLFVEKAASLNSHSTFIQVMAPHLVADDEPRGRLLRAIVEGHSQGKSFELGSGSKYVPILHIEDAVSQIEWIQKNYALKKRTALSRVQLKSAATLTVRELNDYCAQMLFSDPNLASFDPGKDAEHEFFMKIPDDWVDPLLPAPNYDLEAVVRSVC